MRAFAIASVLLVLSCATARDDTLSFAQKLATVAPLSTHVSDCRWSDGWRDPWFCIGG